MDHRRSRGCVQRTRSEEHTSELQSRFDIVCRLLLEKKKNPQLCPLSQPFTPFGARRLYSLFSATVALASTGVGRSPCAVRSSYSWRLADTLTPRRRH